MAIKKIEWVGRVINFLPKHIYLLIYWHQFSHFGGWKRESRHKSCRLVTEKQLFELPFIAWQHVLQLCARKTQALPAALWCPASYPAWKNTHTSIHPHRTSPGSEPQPTNQISECGFRLNAANKVLFKSTKTDVEIFEIKPAAPHQEGSGSQAVTKDYN